MADRCYLCNVEGSVEYPLMQCNFDDGVRCERLCCREHRAPHREIEYCLHHQGQKLDECMQENMSAILTKLAVPPVLRTDTMENLAADTVTEILEIYAILEKLGYGLDSLHENLIRGIRDGRLYA